MEFTVRLGEPYVSHGTCWPESTGETWYGHYCTSSGLPCETPIQQRLNAMWSTMDIYCHLGNIVKLQQEWMARHAGVVDESHLDSRTVCTACACTSRMDLMLALLCCCCARISALPDSSPTPLKSNQDSKLARSAKMSGNRKLSRLHSSLRLFCRGVPASEYNRITL